VGDCGIVKSSFRLVMQCESGRFGLPPFRRGEDMGARRGDDPSEVSLIGVRAGKGSSFPLRRLALSKSVESGIVPAILHD